MKIKINYLLFFLLTCFNVLLVKAGDIEGTGRLEVDANGNPISIIQNNILTVEAPNLPAGATDNSYVNLITFGVIPESPHLYATRLELEVELNVVKYNSDNSNAGSSLVTLTIVHDPFSNTSYTDAHSKLLDNPAYRFVATVSKITINGDDTAEELPKNVYLDGFVVANRNIDFLSNIDNPIPITSAFENQDCNIQKQDALTFAWGTVPGAIEYQLEWTFINNYDYNPLNQTITELLATDLKFNFKHNSTRVSTTASPYTIPLIFERGYLLYRVRAVGVDPVTGKYLYGVWSRPVSSGLVSDFQDKVKIEAAHVHEENINWQLTTTFAEEGKKKEVVNYADGSNRSRQTVTKINSSNNLNVIVAETVYDYQGRPAVNILPVPVEKNEDCTENNYEPSIRFYPNFNINEGNTSYTKLDFDLDTEDPCLVGVGPLKTSSGASNYYSIDNPDKEEQQAFLPDAKKFPFTQVEYTPDNTGRIRRQSGVGEDFMLNSGHETKYYYGKPDQIYLDRLFGSEVGYAAHYKKNAVVDANGQVSVSYLDQEGRVVATALAGTVDNGMIPLESEDGAQKQLTVDYFEKNFYGVSSVNTVNLDGDGIEFSKEILVITPGDYIISYDVTNTHFVDECLPNICFHCVYDLEIVMTDECSEIVNDLSSPSQPVYFKKLTGVFTENNGEITFNTNCENTAYINNTYSFTANLLAGNYTISKKLKIHQPALEYFASVATDTLLNTCITPLSVFVDAEMAQIDTSSCYITCESCVESLGSKEEFVTSGAGTAVQYDILVKQCMEPCDVPTLCEIRYEQMLIDVSKGGQYAKYLDSENAFYNDPLSVFSYDYYLPIVYGDGAGGKIPLWKKPDYEGSGDFKYYDEFGSPARVTIIVDEDAVPTVYSPAVSNSALVVFDNDLGIWYTAPENLANVMDFVDAWQPSWAKSLVKYHPEYCYYLTCSGYANEDENENSSDEFDKLLMTTRTFDNALLAGLIKELPPPNSGVYVLNDYFTADASHPYDPFLIEHPTYAAAIQAKMQDYQSGKSMLEIAAILTNCGSAVSFNPTPPLNCSNFGGQTAELDDQIWNTFVTFYLSTKQQQQAAFEEFSAKDDGGCYNGCIGIENNSAGTFSLGGGLYEDFMFETTQPCNFYRWYWYRYKTKRFQTANDLPSTNIEELSYQHYLQTGQCPNLFNLQQFISELATNSHLTSATPSFQVNEMSSFGSLLLSLNNYDFDNITPPPAIFWEVSSMTSNQLQAIISVPDAPSFNCEVNFDASAISSWDWEDVVGFSGMQATGSAAGVFTFEVVATINNGGTISHHVITGSTCVDILNCQFQGTCDANDIAQSVQNIMSMLATQQTLDPTQPNALIEQNYNLFGYTISNPDPLGPPTIQDPTKDYEALMNLALLNTLQTTNTQLVWNYDQPSLTFQLIAASPGLRLDLHILSISDPSINVNDIAYFGSIQSENEHYFAMDAYGLSGNILATVHFEALLYHGSAIYTPVEMGECDLPRPANCSEPEHILLEDLGDLLKDVLKTKNYNIYASPKMTSLLQSYLPPNVTSNGSSSYDGANWMNLNIPGCTIALTIDRVNNVTPALNFTHVVDLGELIATGPIQQNNQYDFYAVTLFNHNGDVYIDTIRGRSCIPLRNCDQCTVYDIFPDTTTPTPPIPDPGNEASKFIIDESPITYREYKQTVDSVNVALNLTTTDSNYIKPVDYKTYFNKRYTTVAKTYKHFAKGFNPEIDDINYLKKPEKFNANYGHLYNMEKEYSRYTKAVQKYNSRITAPLDSMQVMDLVAFTRLKVPVKHNNDYVNYLQQYPQQDTIAAKELTDFFVDEQVVMAAAEPTDSCEILYNEYSLAYKTYSTSADSGCMVNLVLASYDDVIDYNLCCSAESRDIFRTYIATFDTSLTDCPKNLPKVDVSNMVCDKPTTDPRDCVRNFELYVGAIYAYNKSVHAQQNNHQLFIFPSKDYFLFEKMGFCDCVTDYLKYLYTYIDDTTGTLLPLPDLIYNVGTCSDLKLEECTIQYFQYDNAINKYNESDFANQTNYYLTSLYTDEEAFKQAGACGETMYRYMEYLEELVTVPIDPNFPPPPPRDFEEYSEPVNDCEDIYNDYVQTIADFNASTFAQQNNIVVFDVFGSADELINNTNACECVSSYINYLLGFINQGTPEPLAGFMLLAAAEPTFQYIEDYCRYKPASDCDNAYLSYMESLQTYNSYVLENDFDINYSWPVVTQIYSSTEFTASGMCYCVEPLMAYINAVTSGYNIPHDVVLTSEQITFINNKLDLRKHCLEPPCIPTVVPLDTITPVIVPYVNPCVEQMLSIATHNAEQAYNDYIRDLITGFADQYRQHCLGATENLTATFDDKEYHYTLYYYDQSGNLVRTIPPEGVEVMPTTSSFDPVSLNINSDRTNSERTIFTNHSMPTTYLYNSLNQLVRQNVPDHDKMDLYQFSLTSGLEQNLVVTAVQFVNGNKGYLTGYKTVGASTQRGFLYTTSDAGKTWTRLYDLVASNLKKVQWTSSTNAYAIGSEGVLIRTTDGGMNWDMVDLYHLGISGQLNDLYFENDNEGVIVGNNGLVITWNGSAFSKTSPGGSNAIPQTDHLTAVAKNGSTCYVTAVHQPAIGDSYGTVYSAPFPACSNWTKQDQVKAPDYNDVVFVQNSSTAYAAGDNGLLLSTDNAGDDWYVVETNHRNHFKQLFFVSPLIGIAIIEQNIGGGEGLFKTQNGGMDWIPVDNLQYQAFYVYKNTGSDAEALAVGDNGKINRIIINASGIGLIGVAGRTENLKAAWAKLKTSGDISAIVSDGDQLFYSSNIKTTPNWKTFDANLSQAITGINAADFGAPLPALDVNGTLLLDNNDLIEFRIDYFQIGLVDDGTGTGTLIPVFDNVINTGTASLLNNVTDVTAFETSGQHTIYAYSTTGNISKTVPTSQPNPRLTGTPLTYLSATTLISAPANYNSLSMLGENNVLLASLTGKLQKYSASWIVQTERVRPLKLSDINTAGGELLAVGKKATLLSSIQTGLSQLITNSYASNWLAIAPYQTTEAIICGEQGVLKKLDVSSNYAITPLTSSTTNQLNDVAVSNTDVFVVGNDATVLYSSDAVTFSALNGATNVHFMGLSISPSGKVAMVGNNSNVYLGTTSGVYRIKQLFTPALRKVHFTNAAYGYVVGDNYTARYTQNGGQSFGVVLPQNGFVPNQVPQLTSVFTTKNNEAYLTGKSQYLGKATALTTTLVSAGNSGDDFNDITFTSVSQGFVVGGNATESVVLKISDLSRYSVSGAALNGVFGFKRSNSIIAVGNNAQVVRFDGTTIEADDISAVTTQNLHDVYFHDDINGYAVGENGTLLKTTSASTFDTPTGLIIDLVWAEKDITENFLNQPDQNFKNLYTIDFADRYNGFVGGEYTAGSSTVPFGYARLFNDESEMFSSRFFYDRLGRLVASQNTKQFNATPKRFSYTLYDALGRIKEVGEKDENTNLAFNTVFGTDVSGLYNPNTIDDTKLLAWINGVGNRKQVTKTYYDVPMVATTAIDFPTDFAQENLRKRVATVTYEELFDGDDETYQFATHYAYDIHGNVKALLHDNPELAARNSSLADQRYKRMDYTYDLISGNVKMVSYQNGQPDAWHHAYEYDADNRITAVYTSTYKDAAKSEFSPFSFTGAAFWEEDARYHYYHHGPLARVELGENNVQGVDRAYMINGWLVATNSNTLEVSRDMGLDGSTALLPDGSENSNKNFARDAFSFSLGYYNGDYTPIDASATFLADKTGSDLQNNTANLYNGNISSMVTTITTPVTFSPEPSFEILAQSNAYTYDRLNRLAESKSFANLDYDNNLWMNSTNPYDGRYHNQFTYNANGGMLTALAKNALGETIDNQTYNRATVGGRYVNNRTYAITDVATQTSGEDLLDQQVFDNTVLNNNNYGFTEIGERSKNLSADIESITWTVYGKKAGVKRTATSGKNNVTFNYDPQNNRIAKHVYTSDDIWINSEYYVRDAQGNLMATYRLEASSGSGLSYKLTERQIYGSDNLGFVTTPVELVGVTTQEGSWEHILGEKRFNGSNHLGNVLSVFTDKKLPLDIDNNGIIDGYLPEVIAVNDYAPFGGRLSERTFNKELYPNSFNGKREDIELDGSQDYGERDYNPQEREFDKVDPLTKSYPFYSPYQFAGNKPIQAIDLDGLEEVDFRVLEITRTGNAIVSVIVKENTTSRSFNGVLQIHSIGGGEPQTQTPSRLLNQVLGINPNNPTANNPNVKGGVGANFTPSDGYSDYYLQFDQSDLAVTGVGVLNITNEGNYLENNSSSTFGREFLFSVPPDPAPIVSGASIIPSFVGLEPNKLINDITSDVGNSVAQTGQSNNQITIITIEYPDIPSVQQSITQVSQQLSSQYPNATVVPIPTSAEGDISVNVTVTGSATQNLIAE